MSAAVAGFEVAVEAAERDSCTVHKTVVAAAATVEVVVSDFADPAAIVVAVAERLLTQNPSLSCTEFAGQVAGQVTGPMRAAENPAELVAGDSERIKMMEWVKSLEEHHWMQYWIAASIVESAHFAVAAVVIEH